MFFLRFVCFKALFITYFNLEKYFKWREKVWYVSGKVLMGDLSSDVLRYKKVRYKMRLSQNDLILFEFFFFFFCKTYKGNIMQNKNAKINNLFVYKQFFFPSFISIFLLSVMYFHLYTFLSNTFIYWTSGIFLNTPSLFKRNVFNSAILFPIKKIN